jgi:hypothetical protein
MLIEESVVLVGGQIVQPAVQQAVGAEIIP